MSDPPPSPPDGKRSRSDAASRLAALLSDVGDDVAAPPEPARPGPARRARRTEVPAPDAEEEVTAEVEARYDLRSLDRMLAGSGDEPVPAVPEPRARVAEPSEPEPPVERRIEAPPRAPAPAPEERPLVVFDEPDDALLDDVLAVDGPGGPDGPDGPDDDPDDGTGDQRAEKGRGRRPRLKTVAFGAALVLLVAAIPALGVLGAQRLGDSRGGNVTQGTRNRNETGYLAMVVPTRTALIVHRAPDETLGSATLLSYTEESIGGTVLQIPLTTQVRNIRYVTTQLGQTYSFSNDVDAFHREVEDRLGVAIQEQVVLSDGQIAELVRPVAPLAFENSDAVVLDDGRTIDSGSVEVAAEDVGPFLRSDGGSESELAVLARNEMLWTAYLQALGNSGGLADDGVSATDLGPFLESLAAGAADGVDLTRVETLDVGPQVGSEDPALVPEEGFAAQVNSAVPYPQSPGPGRRYSLKLLNGVAGEQELPRELMHDLVMTGASLVWLGNASEFGQETSTIEVASDGWDPQIQAAELLLGGGAEVVRLPEVQALDADVDVVIIVGQDALRAYEERSGG